MLLPADGLVHASLGHTKLVHRRICDYSVLDDEALALKLVQLIDENQFS